MVTVPNAMPAHAHKSRDILAHHQSRILCAMKKRMNVSFFGGPCAKTLLFFFSHDRRRRRRRHGRLLRSCANLSPLPHSLNSSAGSQCLFGLRKKLARRRSAYKKCIIVDLVRNISISRIMLIIFLLRLMSRAYMSSA